MRKLAIAIIALGLSSPFAFAQASFKLVDTDGDGLVTLNEANGAGLSWTQEEFAQADRNGDGGLNAAEFAAATQ